MGVLLKIDSNRHRLPTFLIVGAARCGTTSLWRYLKQHPDIFMPENKEPLFFVSSVYESLNPNDPTYNQINELMVSDYTGYRRLFAKAGNAKAIGEASVPYLYYHETAIPNIKKYIGDVKVIIVLRNPVERAFSAYSFLSRDQRESRSFEECIALEALRKRDNWAMIHFYKQAGFYYEQVKAFLDNFSSVRVYLFDDLQNDALGLVRKANEFLNVSPSFVPRGINIRHNASGVPRSAALHRIVAKQSMLRSLLKPFLKLFISESGRRGIVEGLGRLYLEKPDMEASTRESLKNAYHDDVIKLQDLIGRDLNAWLK